MTYIFKKCSKLVCTENISPFLYPISTYKSEPNPSFTILLATISFSRSKSSNASLRIKEVLISDKKLLCLLKSSSSQFSSLVYQGLVICINPSSSFCTFVRQSSTGLNKILLNSRKICKILMTFE